MAANRPIKITHILAWLVLVFPALFGCNQSRDTIRHGDLSYSAPEIFGSGTAALVLAEAAARGDVKEIDRQTAAGADVNIVGKHEITPLWWAAWAENYQGFAALLEKGANPNCQRSERYPLMLLVAEIKDPRFLEAALKHGGDPNLRDRQSGETPLFPAVLHGYKAHIDLLLAAKAEVNARLPVSGETLPMVAMARSDYQLVSRLLNMGADPTLKLKSGQTLADFIAVSSVHANNNSDPWRAKVIEFLQSKGMTVKNASK